MVRAIRLSFLINIIFVCSLSLSVILIIWNSTLEKREASGGTDFQDYQVNEQDEKFSKFHTTFNFKDPIESGSNTDREEIQLLKEELASAKLTISELKDEKSQNRERYDSIPHCQLLHVAVVCAGYKETRRVVTLIKSILFHRKNPLHFHFISDAHGRHVLNVLFMTWNLEKVKISYYDADKLKAEVEWIPNTHYSGVYGLMKLTLTKALPEVLEKVVVLDTDVFFLTDIGELWKLFDKFAKEQAIGLVENQSEWYTGKLWKRYKHWPALGRGFNTGVMLFDLKKLRGIEWTHLWRLTAEKQLVNLFTTVLADQDVINSAIKDNPQVVYKLPCEWNIQLSDNTKSEDCYKEVTELKIIHWNSPKKQAVKHKHVEFFRNMYLTYLQYDGNLLRKKIFSCNDNIKEDVSTKMTSIDESDDQCHEFTMEQNLSRRVHLFYLDYDYLVIENDITLLAHLSMDRLQVLLNLVEQWKGPMSIALYASDAEAQQFVRYSQKTDILNKRKNIGIHIVYKDGDVYPVNYLRNIALEQVQTRYVFLCDIDFLPMAALYDYVKHVVGNTDMHKKAIIVPAFETFQYKFNFPDTKTQLLYLWESNKIEIFRSSVWPQGHAPTDYVKWKTANDIYKVKWQADYEPYIIVEKKNVPYYDMRFVGFGWNKVSHIMELYASGYEFLVVPEGFIIHMPHAPSFELTKFRSNSQYRKCLRFRKEEFIREMERKYNMKYT